MRYTPIDHNLFVSNRQRLVDLLPANSLVILNANDIMPLCSDGVMPFRQNSDLFYLSGIDQEETILVLHVGANAQDTTAYLFLKETNEYIAIWEGKKYTKSDATKTSGIEQVLWIDQFKTTLHRLMCQVGPIYLNSNEHPRAVVEVETRDTRFITWCRAQYPLHSYQRLAPLMHRLRIIKSETEISLQREACRITEIGFRRVLDCVKPGIMEYELESELAYTFIRNRSRGFAFTPIIASGANACVLHYIENNQPCRDGDTILLDIGAEYANYCADLTRVIPVNGRFTPRQRAVYNAVLRTMRYAITLLTPGNTIEEYYKATGEFISQELVTLGLLDKTDIKNQTPDNPAYKKYFMHGVSHHLGLDSHDVGDARTPFAPCMVLTVEPGIYIREENLGIRLENDIVIRENGIEDLMAGIPIEAEEIEALISYK